MTEALSPRETHIMHYICLGLTAKEVAKELSVRPTTVQFCLEIIRLKLFARNTTHAAVIFSTTYDRRNTPHARLTRQN